MTDAFPQLAESDRSNAVPGRGHGVNMMLTDREFIDSSELGIELAFALAKLFRDQFHVEKMLDILSN